MLESNGKQMKQCPSYFRRRRFTLLTIKKQHY